jgi:hypothetical protein
LPSDIINKILSDKELMEYNKNYFDIDIEKEITS